MDATTREAEAFGWAINLNSTGKDSRVPDAVVGVPYAVVGVPDAVVGVPDAVVGVPSSKPTLSTHKDHLIWSLVNLLNFNPLCCSLLALVFSIKARDRLQRGDVKEASSWGRRACCLNSILTGIFIGLIIVCIVMMLTGSIDRHKIYRIPFFPSAVVQQWSS